MEEQEQYKRLFRQLVNEEEQLHKQNQRRIRSGIRCLVWIPLLFLALLFLTESEKAIFLVLWVVSLFVIAGYLMYIEYIDFQAQERLHRYTGKTRRHKADLAEADTDTDKEVFEEAGLMGADMEAFEEAGLIGADMEAFEATVLELLRQIEERKTYSRQERLELLRQQKEKLLGRKVHHDEYH
ncbi:MAG: hypothetical protein K2N87_03390 [Eubacterium sp.]|nr:hypothetical protein [Eubacterium sp.]